MKKFTLLRLKLILVFLLFSSASFSQNAILILSGSGVDISNNDTTPSLTDNTDFGNLQVGSTLNHTFVLRNTGTVGNNASKRITFSNPAVTITGTDAAQFSIISGPASGNTLNGDGAIFSPNLVVRFTPTAPAGIKNATITVQYTNNGGALTYTYSITGTAEMTPEINIQGNATVIVDGDITPTITDWSDFGSSSPGSGITRTFTIQNTGSTNLTIGAISFSGVNAADFTVTTAPAANLAASASTTFVVRFTPTSNGIKTATISIVNNDSNEDPYNFAIQGTGFQAFYDSDGDGVFDNVDVDDDNDGIRDNIEEANCNTCNGNKVNYKFLNETFGTGTIKTTINTTYDALTTYCYEDGIAGANTTECPNQSTWILDDGEYCVDNKITGTTASDPENIHGDLAWYNGEDHTVGDVAGRMAVFNASFTPGTFYETTITGVLSNLPITYSFWVLNIMAQSTFPGSILPNVTVEFLDLSNNILSTFNTGDIGRCSGSTTDNTCSMGVWKQFSTSVNLGNINTFVVRFKNNAPGGGGNDLALDDILITQTLCDRDNDGVADLYDLDSDNDGIEDVIEAGLANMSNGKGRIDVTWVDANGNGHHDTAESLVVLDSDGDSVPNYLDLDSDNDSIFDVDESGAGNINAAVGFVNGDGDITGDGVGDGLETETFRNKDSDGNGIVEGFGDGILDIYDYANALYGNLDQGTNVAPFLNYLLDTDGDEIPNYIDVITNGVTYDIAGTIYASLDANNNGLIDGTADIDKDGILDAFDTNTAVFGSPRDLNRKLFLDFDGRNDYGQATGVLGGLANASLMAWIDLNSTFANDGVIIGQDKFQIRISSTKKLEAIVNGTTLTFNTVLNTSQWYHVAVVFGGGFLKLYLNGALVANQSATGSIATDTSLLTLGKNPIANTSYFKGKIDEVRVFNVALTDAQVQRMVYQEIYGIGGGQISGYIVPKDIGSLPYANLLKYYRMDVYKDDIIDNLTTLLPDVGVGMEIYNHKVINVQQAPMPFLTERTGDFATAVNSPTKEIRGMDIMDYDWSIVQVKHDVTETSNCVDLGMIVDSGKNIIMNNDTKLQNDWYLKLDGKIDLQGHSQLVQTTQSDLDPLSSGSLERDQQGTNNIYNYNYWSSPVGPINALTNNNNLTIADVFKDGTNPSNPTTINWTGGYDGTPGNPISLARYWIFKFQNVSNSYANWTQPQETGFLAPSQGFTLKGSGTASADQNYTFIGKPFNGSITNPIAANNLNLSGNPYASTIDANAFINDNSASLTGTLYFWEHYATNDSHSLGEYQGGYATRNLTGGTAPVSPASISGLGTSNRIPGRFIPVGQGFFVAANATGGNIIFNNGQRLFVKEDNVNSNVMFKNEASANADDSYEEDSYSKIRLGYTTQNNYHRQVLLGFMDEKATSGLDYGYDALLFDQQNDDMCFLLGTNKLIIQGDGYYNADKIYPIVVKAEVAGKVKFMIDGLENFPPDQAIYIYDADNNTYSDIRNEMFEVEIPIGENTTRFSLRFADEALSTAENVVNEIKVTHTQNDNTLTINNQLLGVVVKKVELYSILGQSIKTWNITAENQQNISIPIQNITTGTYIAKVETNNGSFNKKLIIR